MSYEERSMHWNSLCRDFPTAAVQFIVYVQNKGK